MVRSFRDSETERIFQGHRSQRLPPSIQQLARRKLKLIDAAADLRDLRVPPNNRLEKLKGDRKGQHSIRINRQYRICFVWRNGNAYDVEIVDYH
ncbi:MAG: type II toxin-antitoxin system RelE/ParE family toxin [Alphaproteobacteria bacterium]|nr:type II toxin-antitoxin system RelE/ParE family toxin [Alphaproteobacteria bacterium]